MASITISNDGRLSGEIVAVLIGVGMAMVVSLMAWSLWTLMLVPVFLLAIIFVLRFYGRYKASEFDESCFYYRHHGKMIQVPLTDILKISRSHWPVDSSEIITISFKNQANEKENIRIIPIPTGNRFQLFIEKLKAVNPGVETGEDLWDIKALRKKVSTSDKK